MCAPLDPDLVFEVVAGHFLDLCDIEATLVDRTSPCGWALILDEENPAAVVRLHLELNVWILHVHKVTGSQDGIAEAALVLDDVPHLSKFVHVQREAGPPPPEDG